MLDASHSSNFTLVVELFRSRPNYARTAEQIARFVGDSLSYCWLSGSHNFLGSDLYIYMIFCNT